MKAKQLYSGDVLLHHKNKQIVQVCCGCGLAHTLKKTRTGNVRIYAEPQITGGYRTDFKRKKTGVFSQR